MCDTVSAVYIYSNYLVSCLSFFRNLRRESDTKEENAESLLITASTFSLVYKDVVGISSYLLILFLRFFF